MIPTTHSLTMRISIAGQLEVEIKVKDARVLEEIQPSNYTSPEDILALRNVAKVHYYMLMSEQENPVIKAAFNNAKSFFEDQLGVSCRDMRSADAAGLVFVLRSPDRQRLLSVWKLHQDGSLGRLLSLMLVNKNFLMVLGLLNMTLSTYIKTEDFLLYRDVHIPYQGRLSGKNKLIVARSYHEYTLPETSTKR